MPVGICWRNLYRVVAQNYEEAWVEKFWGWECAWHFQVSFTFSAGYFSLGCSLPWVCLNVNGGIQVQDKDLASGECVPSVCPPQSWLLSSPPSPSFSFKLRICHCHCVLLRATLGTPTTSPAVTLPLEYHSSDAIKVPQTCHLAPRPSFLCLVF